jgi:hypothetical protein
VLEIARAPVGVVTASASAEALELLLVPGRAFACRVADDELLLLSAPPVTDEVAREAATRLAALDPDALVIDTTDGWAAISVVGDDAWASFGLLSRLELPEAGFLQGEVVHVPAKVVADHDTVLVLVPSIWDAHLYERAATALGLDGPLETRPWAVPTA